MFNKLSIAKVEKRLYLKKGLNWRRWAWRRVLFGSFALPKGVNKHILIVGESGSGKSNAAKMIIKYLSSKGSNFVVFDPHDEYIELSKETNAELYDAGYVGSDIFDLGEMNIKEKSSELTELFRRIFRLGEVQSNTLYKLLEYTYNLYAELGRIVSMNALLYSIKVFKKHAGKGELAVLNAIEKRFMLANELAGRSVSIEHLLGSRSIFTLSSLHTSEAQTIYIEGFLRKIYTKLLSGEKGKLDFYIVIDEAEKLGQSGVLAKLANEGRKYGIGIIAIAQHAKMIEKNLRGNASLLFAFYQREPEEMNYVANMIAGGNELDRFLEIKKALRRLRQGEAILLSSGEPLILKFNLFKGAQDARYFIYKLAKKLVKEDTLFERLRSIGFSDEEIKRSMLWLAKKGFIGTYFLGESIYKGRYYIAKSRNGSEHDIMVNLISMHLRRIGVTNKIYNSSYGPDIIARIDGKKVAVEYETGKKNIEESRDMLLKRSKKFDRVIVVANIDSDYNIEGVEKYSVEEFLSKEKL